MPTASDNSLAHWAAQIRAGDVRALARAITAVEDRDSSSAQLLEALFPHTGNAYLIGITGAAGAGKSTLVDRLAAGYREQGRSVGVIAVDPTSPYTGGAILGDRIRMQRHAADAGMFIRSMATRGSLGGLGRATSDVALLLDAAGKEIVIIETVGVGQDEVDIARLADCTLVLVVPGLGDDVQSMKAGLMEIADVFVLNKADRDGADALERELAAAIHLAPAHAAPVHAEAMHAEPIPGEGMNTENYWQPPIVRTIATTGEGVPALVAAVDQFRAYVQGSGIRRAKALAQWKRRLLVLLEEQLLENAISGPGGERALDALARDVADRKKSPHAAVRELIDSLGRAAPEVRVTTPTREPK